MAGGSGGQAAITAEAPANLTANLAATTTVNHVLLEQLIQRITTMESGIQEMKNGNPGTPQQPEQLTHPNTGPAPTAFDLGLNTPAPTSSRPIDKAMLTLVQYLARKGVHGFPKKGYGTEIQATKDDAEEIPVFDMVDDLIRAVSELLGQSSPCHAWNAVIRLIAVLPTMIVVLKDFNSKVYAVATSYPFHFFLFFLADVLEQLNKTFQQRELDLVSSHAQIKRTTNHIKSRYVDCGNEFGGGMSQWLLPFLEHHGLGCNCNVTVEGVDSDGRPTSFTFTLHNNLVDWYSGPEHHNSCVDMCTEFAERIVASLPGRLGDLDSLSGFRLFMPDAWPLSKAQQNARCQEWFHSLVTMSNAQDRKEILPGAFYLTMMCTFYCNLWVVVAVILLTSMEFERGFFWQHVIESWLRGGIKDARLGDLICMSMMQHEPNYDEVVGIWQSFKKRKPFSNAPICTPTPGDTSK
ncbi:unnamed protein product [Closterium sp. NIES-54]